ncbi:MAG: hypothetical protein DHS20C17_10730 [Cyclobacteriaceae bacterium]|nr:MAG: hypothetical protein DHS20C17_10730 [Cyclobacteriaceae bacterium]
MIGCGNPSANENQVTAAPPSEQQSNVQSNPLRDVYFGDTHVHTGWSMDAGLDGAVKSPRDAYRYALGEKVEANSGIDVQLKYAYDWFMVTDHSDAMGVVNKMIEGNEEMMAVDVVKKWAEAIPKGGEEAASAKSELVRMQANEELPAIVMDPKWMKTAWEETVDAAEEFNKPGEFTTFIAYEWTVNADGGNNLHRNVIFRDGADKTKNVLPLTTFETQDPLKLWEWLQNYENSTGGQVLAIPHNGNMSNGRMFEEQQFDGSPMTKEWANLRNKYERLYELYQIKGQSEAHPSLSTTDEFADYALWDRGNLILRPKKEGDLEYEYWREALKSGLRLEQEFGINPFKYGANAGTDTHTGLSSTEEDNYNGKFKTLEPTNHQRWNFPLLEGVNDNYMGWEQEAAGFMGVWAESNTREAIWDAMKRRETYASSGSRMKVRFFGGFDFTEEDLNGNLAQAGYDKGVPMGGDISGSGNQSPIFMVSALKAPNGANLDRIQIIKGWLDVNGQTHEKVYDVIWSGDRKPDSNGKVPPVGNTVNLETAEYTNTIGSAELKAVFKDPDFDPSLSAVYYVRVLEIPTPRWTLYDKVRFNIEMDQNVPLVTQERVATSPIWYDPN